MIVDIADYEFPGVWDGVYHFALSDYPNISDWELRKLILFIEYEKKHDRKTEIICGNDDIMRAVNGALANPASFLSLQKPDVITECTACKQGGCGICKCAHALIFKGRQRQNPDKRFP